MKEILNSGKLHISVEELQKMREALRVGIRRDLHPYLERVESQMKITDTETRY